MGTHRKPVRKRAPYVTTGIALGASALIAASYATDGHISPKSLLTASTSIFVDGTMSITGNEEGVSPTRVADSFKNTYDQRVLNPGVGKNSFFE